ncbi:MAG: ABC transporter permease [Clostridiales bacterium]|nr:ABC transporter permease [Clostridiales bacterium]
MRTIYARELRSYFATMSGYVFIAAFLLSTGLFFTVNNVLMDSDSLSAVLLSNCYIMILIVPPLTMRLFAEERHSRTEQMWLSAPIRLSEVVSAKFLAAATVFGAALVASLAFPVLLMLLGSHFHPGEAVVGYIGCALVGICLIAVGMFLSALFESQLSCALATAVAILMLYLADTAGPHIPLEGVREAVCGITPYYHLRLFRIGLLLPTSAIRLVSFAAVFVLMTIVALDARVSKARDRRPEAR